MNTKKLFVTLASITLAVAGSTVFAACSSDDSNAGPMPLDGGGGGFDATGDTNSTGDDTGTGGNDTGTAMDSATDAPPCTPDAAATHCDTCATNPLNVCSPATANCLPFDNTRVPSGVPAHP